MSRRGSAPRIMYMDCKGGCGKKLASLSKPIVCDKQTMEKFQGYCKECMPKFHPNFEKEYLEACANILSKKGVIK